MSGNTLGTLFCVTSFGESHGPAIGCVVDGCPPGLALEAADIQRELDRRKPGTSRHVTQRRESDTVEILSGVFEGRTTGTPIALLIRNEDARSKDYAAIADTFRPGHADYAYWQKYGIRDYRGGGRASARETAVRVAAGAIARKWLAERHGVRIRGHLVQLGPKPIPFEDWSHVDANPFFVANAGIVPELEAFMDALRKSGDSCGAKITVVATGVPLGWGEPVYGRLDADLAQAMMGINAVKGVEIGSGFASVTQSGQRAFGRNDAAGLPVEQRRRHPRRHLDGPGGRRDAGREADVVDPPRPPLDRQGRASGRREHARTTRPVRRHSRHADRRSDAGARADGSRAAAPGAERRRGRRRRRGSRRARRPAAARHRPIAAPSTIRIPTKPDDPSAPARPSEMAPVSFPARDLRAGAAARERERDVLADLQRRGILDDRAVRAR